MSPLINDPRLTQVFLEGVSKPIEQEACPTAAELWDALDPDEPSSSLRYRVLNHCARCPACAQDLQITKTLRDEELRTLESKRWSQVGAHCAKAQLSGIEQVPAPVQRPLWPRLLKHGDAMDERTGPLKSTNTVVSSWLRPLAASTSVAAVAAALAILVLPKPQTEVTYRGDTETSQASPDEGKPNSQDHRVGYQLQNRTFSWPASLAPVKHYQLTIVDSTFNEVCTLTGLIKSTAEIDSLSCPNLDRSRPFYWKISSVLRDGTRHESKFVSNKGRHSQ